MTVRSGGRLLTALAVALASAACWRDPLPRPFSTPPPKPAAKRVDQPEPKPAPPAKPGTVSTMDITTFFPLQQSGAVVVYDVRPGIFHSFGHIPGSVSWPRSSFDSGLSRYEPALIQAERARRPVVLYCTDRQCPDAGAVAQRLSALGHSVVLLEGGFAEWKAAGLPVN